MIAALPCLGIFNAAVLLFVRTEYSASRLGVGAVEALINGVENMMVGVIHDKIAFTNFSEAIKHNVTVDPELVRISKILSS